MKEILKELQSNLNAAGYSEIMNNVLKKHFNSVEKYAQYEINILEDKIEKEIDTPQKLLYDFFYFSEPINCNPFIDDNLMSNLAKTQLMKNRRFRWAIYPFKGKYFMAEPQYTSENGERRALKRLEQPWGSVYIGFDSFLLGEYLEPKKGDRVLDLCCGSGIHGILCTDVAIQVTGVDISKICVEVSRMNAILNDIEQKTRFLQGDLYEPVKGETFDYICSNVPYLTIPTGSKYTLEGNGGLDGLKLFRRVLDRLPRHLSSKGRACFTIESVADYSKELKKLEEAGFKTEVQRLHSINKVDDFIRTKVEDAYSEDIMQHEFEKWKKHYSKLGVKMINVDIIKVHA